MDRPNNKPIISLCAHSAIQIVSQNWGDPPETLPNSNYDAPEEVCGDRKGFDSLLQKLP